MRSLSTCVLLIAALLSSVSAVRADMGPSFPGNSDIILEVRFDNLGDYPDYDFYLSCPHGWGNPNSLTKLTAGESSQLKSDNRHSSPIYLVVVPSGKVPPRQVTDDSDRVRKTIPGSLQSSSLGIGDSADGYTCLFHVTIEGDTLIVSPVSRKLAPTLWLRSNIGCVFFGLALSAVGIWLGLRLARKLAPKVPPVGSS
jgi:hypothetical protein